MEIEASMVYNILMSLMALCGIGYMWFVIINIEPFCYYFSFTQKRFYKVHKDINVKFDDIVGMDEIKAEIKETMKNNFGGKMSKGYYFVGPPGTGKTMMAKAIATEINVPFIEVSTNDILNSYIPAVIRTISKNYPKAIILIDECDTILNSFSNSLLRNIDGIESIDNIMFILTSNNKGATNITRSGRIDRIITFNLPSYQDRVEILNKLSIKESEKIAKMTHGFSHADLTKYSIKIKQTPGFEKDVTKTINFVRDGMETCRSDVSDLERPRLIYHEIGHCIISHALKEINKPNTISIVASGKNLGETSFNIDDNLMYSRLDLLKRIGTLLASSVFEQFYLGDHSLSCCDDFDRINEIFNFMDKCQMLKPIYSSDKEKLKIKAKIISDLHNFIVSFIKQHEEVIAEFYQLLNTKEILYQDSIDNILFIL